MAIAAAPSERCASVVIVTVCRALSALCGQMVSPRSVPRVSARSMYSSAGTTAAGTERMLLRPSPAWRSRSMLLVHSRMVGFSELTHPARPAMDLSTCVGTFSFARAARSARPT